MTQKVSELFGISLEIDPDVNELDYVEFRDQLLSHLKDLKNVDLNNVEVYIHQLRISTKPTHFGVSPLSARLSHLGIKIEMMDKARRSGVIWFLNRDLPLRLNQEVEVTAHKHRIAYSLSGDYCQMSGSYNDYIATVIMKSCPTKHRMLHITATAHATERFKERLLNFRGYTTTKISFPLDSKRQLPLTFDKSKGAS